MVCLSIKDSFYLHFSGWFRRTFRLWNRLFFHYSNWCDYFSSLWCFLTHACLVFLTTNFDSALFFTKLRVSNILILHPAVFDAHSIAIIWPFQRSVGVDPVAHFQLQSLTLNSSIMKKNKESSRSGSSYNGSNYVGKYINALWFSDSMILVH